MNLFCEERKDFFVKQDKENLIKVVDSEDNEVKFSVDLENACIDIEDA